MLRSVQDAGPAPRVLKNRVKVTIALGYFDGFHVCDLKYEGENFGRHVAVDPFLRSAVDAVLTRDCKGQKLQVCGTRAHHGAGWLEPQREQAAEVRPCSAQRGRGAVRGQGGQHGQGRKVPQTVLSREPAPQQLDTGPAARAGGARRWYQSFKSHETHTVYGSADTLAMDGAVAQTLSRSHKQAHVRAHSYAARTVS